LQVSEFAWQRLPVIESAASAARAPLLPSSAEYILRGTSLATQSKKFLMTHRALREKGTEPQHAQTLTLCISSGPRLFILLWPQRLFTQCSTRSCWQWICNAKQAVIYPFWAASSRYGALECALTEWVSLVPPPRCL